MNVHEALVRSCDVFFYQVGQRLGVDTIAEYSHRFGLGAPTGITLEHESGGTIPSSEWKRQRFGEPWYPGETLSISIGQGYVTTTPLQMASVMATIANGGVVYRPKFVKRVEGTDVGGHRCEHGVRAHIRSSPQHRRRFSVRAHGLHVLRRSGGAPRQRAVVPR